MTMSGTAPESSSIADLKNEIARVRQTSNEYDLSIQHTLDQIVQRLERLEAAGATYRAGMPLASSPPAPEEQTLISRA